MIAQFRRWFRYECEVNELTLQSLETVPAENRDGADFKRAVSIFAHIVGARRIWLERFGEVAASGAAMFPDDVTLESVQAKWIEVAQLWIAFLDRIDDARLLEKFEYTSLDAGRFSNSVEEVLTQLFGHSWYHRGQIAMLVRSSGGQPAITDYIYWCREPLL